jgi:poly-gamma-glutamate capsule biosynthesis protein CapA/YwtB (metallophosphatase superfamily)
VTTDGGVRRPPRATADIYRRRRLVAMTLITVIVIAGFALVSSRGGGNPDANGLPASGSSSTQSGNQGKTASSPTTTHARRVVKMMFTGDTLIHSALFNQAQTYGAKSGKAYDFNPMFDKVRPIISSADVAICHQETPLTADDKQLSGYPVFSTPHEIADALFNAGYDGCSTASNHSFDRNIQGITDTTTVFEQVGLKQSGMARTPEENAKATIYTANGVTIAHLAYSYGLNGYTLPADKQWLVRLIDKGKESPADQPYTSQFILADAKAARAAGADLVVISIQWGVEYQSKPTPSEVTLANELLASPDIDLVVGHHPHVIQPIDRVGDKYVVFGVGNFLSNQAPVADPTLPAASQDGVIVDVTFTESDVNGVFKTTKVGYTPTWVDRAGYIITPVAAALKDPSTPAVTKTALQQSWQRTTTAINADGAAEKGVAPTAVP